MSPEVELKGVPSFLALGISSPSESISMLVPESEIFCVERSTLTSEHPWVFAAFPFSSLEEPGLPTDVKSGAIAEDESPRSV